MSTSMSRARLRRIRLAMPWAVSIVLLALWELLARAFHVQTFLLPKPTDIAFALREYGPVLAAHTGQTLMTTVAGFALSVTLGLVLGLLIGASVYVYAGLYPLLVAFNTVPKVALIPVLVIWFGIGTVPAVISAFIISFFPIVVNVSTGLATIEPEVRDVLRSLRASRWDILLKVGIPRTLPYLFASLKVSLTLAFVGSIVAETIASNRGVGYVMLAASSRLETPLVFAGVAVVAVLGTLLYALCNVFERRMTHWAFRGQIVG